MIREIEKRPGRQARGAYPNTRAPISIGFDRSRLPDPLSYYTDRAGLKFRERHGKWRTTRCEFHGGSDSMRVNMASGGFVCMAGCGARGGDVLAYHMAVAGLDFVAAAKDLGAWVGPLDERQRHRRPASFSARDGLRVLVSEANLVAVAACNLGHGIGLSEADRERLLTAANRILTIGDMT